MNVRYGADAPNTPNEPVAEIPEGPPTQVAHPNRATFRTTVVVAVVAVLLLVTYVPGLSLWLPRLFH